MFVNYFNNASLLIKGIYKFHALVYNYFLNF